MGHVPFYTRRAPVDCVRLLIFSLFFFVPAVSAAAAPQVLVVHSYAQEYPWTRGQHRGFVHTLTTAEGTAPLISTEHLDTKRRAYDEGYAREFARHLEMKYAGYEPTAIYVTDDAALLFARDHLVRLFPRAPVFFSGVNDYGVQASLDRTRFTGVFERKEFGPNLQWLLQVDRGANDLVFVGDGSATYRAIERELRSELTPYRLRVTFLADRRLDRLLARLGGLPGKYFFLTTLGSLTDPDGALVPLHDVLNSLAATGRLVISMEDAYIAEGVLGGYATSGQKQGAAAAELFLAYQGGTPVAALPPIHKSPNALIFDDRVLLAHAIELPRELRSQAMLLHPRPGLYDRYRSLILLLLIGAGVLLVLVIAGSQIILSGKNRELTAARHSAEAANVLFNQVAIQSRTVHWVTDAEGLYSYISEACATVLGQEPEAIVGKQHFQDLHGAEAVEAFRRRETILELHNLVQPSGGCEIHLSTNGIPSADPSGTFTGYHGSDTDVTERVLAEEEKRNLEERLNRAEKMEALGLLAGGVAHDLNNVLGIIVGYSELMLGKLEGSSSLRPRLEAVMKAGERAAAIVQDLLTLARRSVSRRTVTNLNAIIAELQELPEFRALDARHGNIHLRTELEPDLPNITGSPVHLSKSILNLITNACEAMPHGGSLTIRTANEYLEEPIQGYDEIRKGEYVVLSVSDTGGGISPADVKRIFEPFYTKKAMGRSGTGLGLAVVWGTVQDHDGYINVRSTEQLGSAFFIYLPITESAAAVAADAVALSEYRGRGESILVVDDVQEQRELATELLKGLNYSVASVASGEAAVTYLREHRCDLMVLDMIMDPGLDGLDTYRRVLEIHPHQRAIIVSGFSESDRVSAAQALGSGAYVRKPYLIERLGLAVRNELDRPA